MLLAVAYIQNLDPLGNRFLSTFLAALPVLVLFYLLVVRRWLAPKAGAMGALTAVLVAWLAFDMKLEMAAMSFIHGAAFGLLPIGWTVFGAMLIYNITVETGQFAIIRRSVAALSNDAHIQAILIGFAFGAFMEGAAGAGSPVAIGGAMLVGLGFPPMQAAVICLIANTSPVAFGGLGAPILTLAGVSDIPAETISIMAGHQLPILSCIIPLYMVLLMCGWRKTREIWPVLVVAGGSFAAFQFVFATIHLYVPSLIVFPMTDIGGGIFSLIVTGIFLRFWKPRSEWHYSEEHKASALLSHEGSPLTARIVIRAWMPFIVMSICLMISGFIRQKENERGRKKQAPLTIVAGLQTKYEISIPSLDREVLRPERLPGKTPMELRTTPRKKQLSTSVG